MRSSRRQFLRYAMLGLGGLATARWPMTLATPAGQQLVHDDNLNINIPSGSSIRIVARSGQPLFAKGDYHWHAAPDGGSCFETEDNGWIYVSNSELNDKAGGAGAIRFDADGNIVDAYSILSNTSRNCAGGKTPWNTWLSCEENGNIGEVYECDPFGKKAAEVRPMLGIFNHEAAIIDPLSGYCYMTEDTPDGCLYRFISETKNDLSKGKLQVAVANRFIIEWKTVSDPAAASIPVRYQVKDATRFKGGEGMVYYNRQLFFSTKLDNIVWRYDIDTGLFGKVYDAADYREPLLTGVDNIEVSQSGELLIAEDGGNMQIVALGKNYEPYVLVQVYGHDHSEITGPAFSPGGKHLYFSSQRGTTGKNEDGVTYELAFS